MYYICKYCYLYFILSINLLNHLKHQNIVATITLKYIFQTNEKLAKFSGTDYGTFHFKV